MPIAVSSLILVVSSPVFWLLNFLEFLLAIFGAILSSCWLPVVCVVGCFGWVTLPVGCLHPSGLNFFPFFMFSFIFMMAPHSWCRTVDIVCRDFPARTESSYVAKGILDYFMNAYVIYQKQVL